jgi:hypothetical protein
MERVDAILGAYRGDGRAAMEALLIWTDDLASRLSFGFVRGGPRARARP